MNTASALYRWNILLLLASCQAIAYIDRVNVAVVGPYLITDYGYTAAEVGVLLSIFNWAFTLSLLAAGPLADRIRPRRSFPIGVGSWSLATALCSLTSAFTPLLGFRALVGVGESLMIPSGSRVIRDTFDPRHRALAVGTFFAGNKIGLTLGIPLASVVLVRWGWEWVFYTTGSLGFLWMAWWLAVYRAPPADVAPRVSPTDGHARIRWATLLKYRTTWGVMLGQAGYLYIYYVFATWLPGYLVLQRGMSTLTTGVVGMLPFLIGTLCVLLGGWASDRLIAAGRGVTAVRKAFAVGGLLGATVFTIAGAYMPDTFLAVTLLTCSVASVSFSTSAVNSMPIDVAPPHVVSSLVSLQNFGGNVGGSFAPLVTSLLISSAGDFTVPLLVAAGVALVFGCGSYGLLVGSLDRELGSVPSGSAGAPV
ncbi:MAG: MFS transporter [Acidobacteria bacterium]|nr:MFS transporter [Acidobacteriota bacterium]